MLTKWRLQNFKSVGEESELVFAPLTVFAGANSSGKSTVIQSILLTAQTMMNPVFARPIVLNGHLVRLGSFTDIVSGADEKESISLGFELSVAEETYVPGGRLQDDPPYWRPRSFGLPATLDCVYAFSMRGGHGDKELRRLQPRLEASSLTVNFTSDDGPAVARVRVTRSKVPVEERALQLGLTSTTSQDPIEESLYFEVNDVKPLPSGRGPRSFFSPKAVGVALRHFLPLRFSVVHDETETISRQIVDALLGPRLPSVLDMELDADWEPDLPALRRILKGALDTLAEDAEARERAYSEHHRRSLGSFLETLDSDPSLVGLLRAVAHLPMTARRDLSLTLEAAKDDLRNAVRGGRASKKVLDWLPTPRPVMEARNAVERYFASSMRYLGPLRDEPKSVYPLSGEMDPFNVGIKGEFTAAVLDLHKHRQVEFVRPSSFEQPHGSFRTANATLKHAVLAWLEYMGVATDVKSTDLGKLGHELKVGVGSGRTPLHDLTQVGVGVSQVLPILVLSLLAHRGSTLIFEQPELHLHPKVQTLLGDFFVSMTALGKQCVVETHSEYLVNRLRYRATAVAGREVSDAIILYFVQKTGGQSTFRPVKINEYGVIEDWPEGFFDEGSQLAADTLRRGMQKRHSERNRESGDSSPD